MENENQEVKQPDQQQKWDSLLRKNPNTAGALFLAVISILFSLFISPGWLPLIIFFFAVGRITKANKADEDKKFIKKATYILGILFILTIIFWVASIFLFVNTQLDQATT